VRNEYTAAQAFAEREVCENLPVDDIEVVTDLYAALEQPPEPGAPPAEVMSHAIGRGVIWLSSLYVNQYWL
jgi:hypothetical protein